MKKDIEKIKENLGHEKADVQILQRRNALTENNVIVVNKKTVSKADFESSYYEMLALILGYKEKGASQVIQYLSQNVVKDDLVIVTLKKLATDFDVSITWIARTFDRLVLDGYLENLAQGIWKVSDTFLKLVKAPKDRTQLVLDFELIPEQLETVNKDGRINDDMIDNVHVLDTLDE